MDAVITSNELEAMFYICLVGIVQNMCGFGLGEDL